MTIGMDYVLCCIRSSAACSNVCPVATSVTGSSWTCCWNRLIIAPWVAGVIDQAVYRPVLEHQVVHR